MTVLQRPPVDTTVDWELEDLWGYVALPSTGLADFEAVAHHVAGSGLSTLTQWGGNWALRARHKPTGTLALVTDACATVAHYWLRAKSRIHSDPNLGALTSRAASLLADREVRVGCVQVECMLGNCHLH